MLNVIIEDTVSTVKDRIICHQCGKNQHDNTKHDFLFVARLGENIRKGKVWAFDKNEGNTRLLMRIGELLGQNPIYTFYSENDERMLMQLEKQLESE